MKIRIIGACGSGKSYVAKALSHRLNIEYFETDNMIWNRRIMQKFSLEDRDRNLRDILEKDKWIIEGAQYKWSFESFRRADFIFIIKSSAIKRDMRVLKRFLKMRIRPEEFNYIQSIKELCEMIIQNWEYDKRTYYDILDTTESLKDKRLVVRDNLEILRYFEKVTN